MMKRVKTISLVVVVLMTFLLAFSADTEAGGTINPNGFPSGSHYNLNIIGKKLTFTCPDQQYDEYGNPVYGNVVYVPEYGTGISIYMQSGTGKKAAATTELQVTDPCATFDGNGAVMRLPKNDAGYRVYARALAKPTYNPSMIITPELVSVQDEFGNDLIYLGLVTDNGFVLADGVTLTRTKGKSTALNVTGLFEWSGVVYYFTPPADGTYTTTQICVIDSNGDGIYDATEAPLTDLTGALYCPTSGYTLVTVYGVEYTDEWVFNIADFVEYLWNIDNNGSKLVQVRFYPN